MNCGTCGGAVTDDQATISVPVSKVTMFVVHENWRDCSTALDPPIRRRHMVGWDGRRRSGPVNAEGNAR